MGAGINCATFCQSGTALAQFVKSHRPRVLPAKSPDSPALVKRLMFVSSAHNVRALFNVSECASRPIFLIGQNARIFFLKMGITKLNNFIDVCEFLATIGPMKKKHKNLIFQSNKPMQCTGF